MESVLLTLLCWSLGLAATANLLLFLFLTKLYHYVPSLPFYTLPARLAKRTSSLSAASLSRRVAGAGLASENWLIVIAHPDDECLFFTPVITHLVGSAKGSRSKRTTKPASAGTRSQKRRRKNVTGLGMESVGGAATLLEVDDIPRASRSNVFLLSLSTGNSQGQGYLRQSELKKSCSVFGIEESNVIIIDDKNLQDSMQGSWSLDRVAFFVEDTVQEFQITNIVTFGSEGVSGHVNHKDVHRGVKYFASKYTGQLAVYFLTDTRLLRKYCSWLDTVNSYLVDFLIGRTKNKTYIAAGGWRTGVEAMQQHRTQLVWFRYLYIVFSKYMFVNVLEKYER